MAMSQTWCHVSGTHVTRIIDLEGNVLQVICPHHDTATGCCRLRADALRSGRLAQLLEGVAEDTLTSHGARCALE